MAPAATAAAVPAAKPNPLPTAARLTERIRAMWDKKTRQEWVEVYDYLSPEQKRSLPIAQYLQNKPHFEYANPIVHEVIKLEKDVGYVRLSVVWTPRHPKLKSVRLEPGQTLTEQIELIETWRWTDGDWHQGRPAQSPEEFFQDHPDFLKAQDSARSGPPQ